MRVQAQSALLTMDPFTSGDQPQEISMGKLIMDLGMALSVSSTAEEHQEAVGLEAAMKTTP